MDQQPELDFAAAPTPPSRLPPECLAIVGHLACECLGAGRAKTARQIADAIGMTGADADRDVRRLISLHHAQLPIPVCGHAGRGFYVASDPDELAHYERCLHSQLRALAMRISAARRNASRCGYRRSGSGPSVTYCKAGFQGPRVADNSQAQQLSAGAAVTAASGPIHGVAENPG